MPELPPSPSSPPDSGPPPRRRGRLVRRLALGVVASLAVAGLGLWIWWQRDMPDPFPEYALDLDVGSPTSGPISAGAAAVDITPAVAETWTDANGDGEYDPDDGDTFDDADGDGEFDAVWIAGFGSGRPATGVHDPIWARAVVLRAGRVGVALVSVDVVGLFHTSTIRVREAIAARLPEGAPSIDYVMVASTHGHEGPDTMGLWGPDDFTSGVDPEYMERVEAGVVEAVLEANAALRPATLRVLTSRFGRGVVMHDWRRKPDVVDETLGALWLRDASSGATIATWVNWSNHPETLGDENTEISSDFPHWLRERVEAALGGVCVYANGSIGGMVTTLGLDVTDPETGETLPARGGGDDPELPWRRTATVGARVADEVVRLARESDEGAALRETVIRVRARTFLVPMQNVVFRIAGKLGRLDRGSFDGKLRSEVALVDIGSTRIACVPGEIYPEIVVGGIETPEGADFPVAPVEVPPLRRALSTAGVERVLFVGLANDELGYFIPKSEWDAPDDLPWDSDGNPPYLYGASSPPYGEINSCGPDAAATVHRALVGLLGGDARE